MTTIERGLPLVQHVISVLSAHAAKKGIHPVGASPAALDGLESRLMVELPPTLRAFLSFDYTFATLGERIHGKGRFGTDPKSPKPRLTNVRKLAEARTELGWTESQLKTKLVRLPNRPRYPWHALYLGEARRDGELPILGIDFEDTLVRFWPAYTAFDLYLAEQVGMVQINDSLRLEDLDSHYALNPELAAEGDSDGDDADY